MIKHLLKRMSLAWRSFIKYATEIPTHFEMFVFSRPAEENTTKLIIKLVITIEVLNKLFVIQI